MNDGRDITREHDSERYAIGLRQPVVVRPNEWLAVQGHVYSVSEHDEDRMAEQPSSRKYDTYVRALSFEGDWRKVEQGRLRIVSAGVHQGLDYLGRAAMLTTISTSCACGFPVCRATPCWKTGRGGVRGVVLE